MSAFQGNMFVLVNVDQHRDLIGPIINQLVADYGTPVSIVDNIQKICPKCSCTPHANPDSSSVPTTTSSDEHQEEPPTPKTIAPAPIATPVLKPLLPQRESIVSNGIHPVVVKRKQSIAEEIDTPEIKKSRVVEPVKVKTETIILDDDDGNVLDTVLAALQNGNHEMQFTGSGGSSDDGASNSSNIYDVDDEDYGTSQWNPDFLTNFITSQPNIFSVTGQNIKSSPSKNAGQTPNGKRQVPPMLTVNGKTRRGRIVYSTQELNILEKYYEEDPNACADPRKRETMCKTLSIDYHRLKVWFQNRRRKDKVRSQEEAATTFNGLDYSEDS
ncbi:Homeobox domain-containing protein [Caenorhabditis elegans]|uniref:Homeobox domain-containing protein n=1 Tax=Caenorhabditis elegans TaxID=6239 RepID=Q17792_CAEEL|nr:Homeobox domain-containing protein [Caenorhabditis elegans]CAA90100.3 Homeobox domain-containing protein [Caenorhabditis elegans]|eukprot:NP_496234.3 C. Elegans Homeobox [Caenorhabditis elegans]